MCNNSYNNRLTVKMTAVETSSCSRAIDSVYSRCSGQKSVYINGGVISVFISNTHIFMGATTPSEIFNTAKLKYAGRSI